MFSLQNLILLFQKILDYIQHTILKKFQKKLSFLVIDTTLTLDNSTRFRINFLEILQKLIMAINDKIKDEKLER